MLILLAILGWWLFFGVLTGAAGNAYDRENYPSRYMEKQRAIIARNENFIFGVILSPIAFVVAFFMSSGFSTGFSFSSEVIEREVN